MNVSAPDVVPRGIRNNNPGNIRWGSPWEGLVPENQRTDPKFCQFVTPEAGLRALAIILKNYVVKDHVTSLAGMIARWAPSEDRNDTKAYLLDVCHRTGIPAVLPINPANVSRMAALVEAICVHENGEGNVPYTQEMYLNAVKAATRTGQ